MIAYLVTNKLNGKQYVGITVKTLKYRWNQHCCKNSSVKALHRAIMKYGRDAFTVEHIASAIDTVENLKLLEQELIKQFETKAPKGYNLTDGGEGSTGYQYTAEQNAANSARQKGKKKGKYAPRTPEHCLNLSLSKLGKKQSPEHAAKSRANAIGNKSRTGQTNSEELRKKVSLALKGKPKHPGHGEAVRLGRELKRQRVVRHFAFNCGIV